MRASPTWIQSNFQVGFLLGSNLETPFYLDPRTPEISSIFSPTSCSSGAAQSGVDTDAKATDTEAEDVERDTPCPPKEEIMSMENLEKELIEVEERMLLSNRITIDDGETKY